MAVVQSGFEQQMLARTGAKVEIDAVHLRAIRDEIGDRLHELLRRDASHDLPPRLKYLMAQLAEIDREVAPSIVPSIEDIIVEIRGNASDRNDLAEGAGVISSR
jgi:hypothetical protein